LFVDHRQRRLFVRRHALPCRLGIHGHLHLSAPVTQRGLRRLQYNRVCGSNQENRSSRNRHSIYLVYRLVNASA
jgi:hypothetical protein